MNFLKRLGVLFYVTLVMFISVGIVFYVSNIWSYKYISQFLYVA